MLLSPKARKTFPVAIECKNIAKFAGYKYYDQSKANAKDGQEPIAVVKANLKKPLVLVDMEYFFKLLRSVK